MNEKTHETACQRKPGAALPVAGKPTWIGGPWFDICFFFGGIPLALLLGVWMLQQAAAVSVIWLLWLWLLDGPHLLATWQRTYLDPVFRLRRRRLLLGSLAWLLPGPLLLLMSWQLARPELFLLFLGFAALWSYYHVVRQHYGLQAIYQRLCDAKATARSVDGRLLYGLSWLAFVLFMLMHDSNRRQLGLSVFPSVWLQTMISLLLSTLVLGLLFWCGLLLRRWRQQQSVKPGLYALLVAVGSSLLAFFAVGLREPLLPGAQNLEQVFMAAAVVSGTVHSLQYLGIVLITSQRRMATGEQPESWAKRCARRPVLAYMLMLVIALPYVLLNVLRGAYLPTPAWMPPVSTVQVFLALYWGLFFHHYWLDQQIWRPSVDPQLRAELGIA